MGNAFHHKESVHTICFCFIINLAEWQRHYRGDCSRSLYWLPGTLSQRIISGERKSWINEWSDVHIVNIRRREGHRWESGGRLLVPKEHRISSAESSLTAVSIRRQGNLRTRNDYRRSGSNRKFNISGCQCQTYFGWLWACSKSIKVK